MIQVRNHSKNLGNVIDEMFRNLPATQVNAGTDENSHLPINVHETQEGYHLEMLAPGRNKDQFALNIDKGLLTIGYENKEEESQPTYKTIRREFRLKSFKRIFNLDEKMNADGIAAKYENGILNVFLPKKEELKAEPKKIEVL